MTLLSTLARAAVITAVGASSLGAMPATAAAGSVSMAADSGDEGVVLTVELLDTPLEADGELRASLTVTNDTDDLLPSGHVVLSSGETPFSSRGELSAFLDPSSTDIESTHTLATIDVPMVDASSSWSSTPVTVTSDDIGLSETFGAYAFSGTYVAGNITAQSRDAFVFDAGSQPKPVTVAVAVPITLPPEAESLINAEDLASYTSETGLLTRQLNGVVGRDVTLGIDPRIIASIRALGAAAPESAVEWLDRLERSGNETFPLQYADADPTAQLQSGASSLQQPTSLLFGIDPNNFTPPEDQQPDQPTPTDTTSPSPHDLDATSTPVPPVGPDGIPTLDALLDFPYTYPGAVWPADDTVTTADLAGLRDAELGPVVLSSSNTSVGENTTVDAKVSIADTPAFVADAAASHDLRRAATAASDTVQSDALAALESKLAVIAHEANDSSILLTLGRQWPTNASRMSSVLSALESAPGVVTSSLAALPSSDRDDIELVDKPQSEDRTSTFARVASFDDDIAAFSTALSDPTVLIGRHDAAKLTAYSLGWRSDPEGWSDAIAEFKKRTNDVLSSVTIVQSSPILMIADQISIKISVRNTLDLPVNVIMRASPDNPRLAVESSELTEIPAETQQSVAIPVTARLGNGDVNLRLNLYTDEGVSLASSSTVPVTVRADWERIGTIILFSGVGLLFVFGVIRTVLRRRRERASGDEPSSPAETGDAQSSDPRGDEASGTGATETPGRSDDG